MKHSEALILLFLVCIFSGCEKEEQFHQVPYTTFQDCLYSKVITLEDTFKDVIDQYGISDEMLAPYENKIRQLYALKISYDVHAISYRTVDTDGQPVLASGVIYWPRNRRPAGLIEISPVNKSKGTCGTQEYHMAEAIPGMIEGYICIVPDLLGCGVSSDLPISYLQHENTALVSADMRKAAEEFIYNRYQYKLRSRSILFGYSLGGSCVLSLARLYHQNPSYGVQVTHIFAGGGAYEPMAVIEELISSDRSDYAIIPNILLSMNYYDHLHLDLSSLFKGPLKEHYLEWCDGNVPIAELTRRLGTRPSAYLSEKLLSGLETSPEFAGLLAAVRKKTIDTSWIPAAKVRLFHSAQDFYVPTICGDRLYQRWKSAGADVVYKKYDAPHVLSGLLIELDFWDFLSNPIKK